MGSKIEAYYNYYLINKNIKKVEQDIKELKKNIIYLLPEEKNQIKLNLKNLEKIIRDSYKIF